MCLSKMGRIKRGRGGFSHRLNSLSHTFLIR